MEAVAPYDDAYNILAIKLVVDLNYGDICRVLWDDQFVERMVQKETRNIDFYGSFLDCIVEQVLFTKHRMDMMHELDKLGSWLFQQLDLERLRLQIVYYLDRYGVAWREMVEEVPPYLLLAFNS